jgi:hypothetical protein
MTAKVGTLEIGINDPIPIIFTTLKQCLPGDPHARIIHENVNAAKFLLHPLNHIIHIPFLANVNSQGHGTSANSPDLLSNGLQHAVSGQGTNSYMGSRLGKFQGNCLADSPPASCHDRNPVFQRTAFAHYSTSFDI